MLEQLRSIFRGERFRLRFERRLGSLVEFWWPCRPRLYGNPNFQEEVFLPGGRAETQQPYWMLGGVVELMRCIGRDVKGLAGPDDGFHAAEGGLEFAFEQKKGLLEVVPVGRWTSAGGICISIRQRRPAVSLPVRRIV